MTVTPVLNGWKEIAGYLKIHTETATRLADEEGLPVVRAGGLVLTTTNAIEAWILKNSKYKRKKS